MIFGKELFLALLLALWGQEVRGQCDVYDDLSGFSLWSEGATWPSGSVPSSDDDVTLSGNKKVLLDTDAEVGSLTIEAGSTLVFKNGAEMDLTLTTEFIHLQGELFVGAEGDGCEYVGQATISLKGDVDSTRTVGHFGKKFIGLEGSASRLEVHGKPKKSWTKLAATVNPIPDSAIIYHDKVGQDDKVSGLIAYNFDPTTGLPREDSYRAYTNIRSSTQSRVDSAIASFLLYLEDEVNDNDVVTLALRKSLMHQDAVEAGISHEALFDVIELYAMEDGERTVLRDVQFYDGWSMVFQKGNKAVTTESFNPYKIGGVHQTSTASQVIGDYKYEAVSYTSSRGHGRSFVEFEVTDKQFSVPTLTLAENVDWKPEDDVVIASTDFSWTQVEHGSLVSATGSSITLNWTPRNTHFGQIVSRTDMRAEVAVLTRNVLIQGLLENSNDENGGHIMAAHSFGTYKVENVEIAHMGQSHTKGRYPLHWHRCGGVSDDKTYFKNNAIHHTYARCVTVHATQGATVEGNVCFDSIGHGFFEEDGDEENTMFIRNFGMGQIKTTSGNTPLIPTDSNKPTTFWITNPLTTMVGNSAGGGEGYGIWIMIPKAPLGGQSILQYDDGQALRTPFQTFANNIAHSNAMDGFRLMEGQSETGSSDWGLLYDPRSNPKDPKSAPAPAVFDRLTSYKNVQNDVNVKGGMIQVKRASVSDSLVGISFQGAGSGIGTISDSVVIGQSSNKGEETTVTVDGNDVTIDRSVASESSADSPVIGMKIKDKAIYRDNIWFSGFKNTALYNSGALMLDNSFSEVNAAVSNLGFDFNDPEQGNRLLESSFLQDNQNNLELLVDKDGSLTSFQTGGTVVRTEPFYLTPQCHVHVSADLAMCEDTYAQAVFNYGGRKDSDTMTIARNDGVQIQSTLKFMGRVNLVASAPNENSLIYLAQFNSISSKNFYQLTTKGVDRDNTVLFGICLPQKDAIPSYRTFNFNGGAGRRVCSLNDVKADTEGGAFFFDETVGAVIFKLLSDDVYSATEITQCPGGATRCPSFKIDYTPGTVDNTDCLTKFAANYGTQQKKREFHTIRHRRHVIEKRSVSVDLSANQNQPNSNQGAGDTLQ